MSAPDVFTKSRPDAPRGFFAAEAAGLRWLAEPGAVPVVAVRGVDEHGLHLERLSEGVPDAEAARRFGRALAALHDAGAPGFGWAPHDQAWFGPLDAPFEVPTRCHERFGPFWAQDRLAPLLDRLAPTLTPSARDLLGRAVAAVADGAFDVIGGAGADRGQPPETPARVHGDLWAGNLQWACAVDGTVRGTLIDPAAHGGHRLEDLAMLHLFGVSHLPEIEEGYQEAHPLPDTWREDLPAHQLFALLAHVQLFGDGYLAATLRAAEAAAACG